MNILGADKLINMFNGMQGLFGNILSDNLNKLGLRFEALAKKATPVDTGRLRSSITTQTFADYATVGTNVEYASYIEYGTDKMEARHVWGGQSRVLGQGPFAFALEQFKQGVKNGAKEIARDIENKFNFQGMRGFKPSMPHLPFM